MRTSRTGITASSWLKTLADHSPCARIAGRLTSLSPQGRVACNTLWACLGQTASHSAAQDLSLDSGHGAEHATHPRACHLTALAWPCASARFLPLSMRIPS